MAESTIRRRFSNLVFRVCNLRKLSGSYLSNAELESVSLTLHEVHFFQVVAVGWLKNRAQITRLSIDPPQEM